MGQGQSGGKESSKEQPLKKGEKLVLAHQNLDSIPRDSVEKYSHSLKYFDLSDNNLYKDRDNLQRLAEFKLLEFLNLNANKLVGLPMDMFMLSKLRILDLGRNCLTRLPKQFQKLIAVETLILSENQLDSSSVRMISEMYSLITLDMVSNNLMDSYFPPANAWYSLEILDLSANSLTTIPRGICELPAITHLSISSNKLRTIPPEVVSAPQLFHTTHPTAHITTPHSPEINKPLHCLRTIRTSYPHSYPTYGKLTDDHHHREILPHYNNWIVQVM